MLMILLILVTCIHYNIMQLNSQVIHTRSGGVSVCACARIPHVLGPKSVAVGLCLVSVLF